MAKAPASGLLRRSADDMARRGRGGDNAMAHVAKGEMVLPLSFMQKHEGLMVQIVDAMGKAGIDPRTRIVGTPQGPTNPKTGAEEFKDGDQGDGPSSDIGGAGGSTASGDSGGGGGNYTSPGQADQDLANDQVGGKFGDPGGGGGGNYTGIGFVDRQIDKVVKNPATSLIDFAVGFTPLGPLNTISGLLGGPTVGKATTAAARAATQDVAEAPGGKAAFAEAPGPGKSMGPADGGPDSSEPPAQSQQQAAALPAPDAYVPAGLLTPATNRLSNKARPTPATRFHNRA